MRESEEPLPRPAGIETAHWKECQHRSVCKRASTEVGSSYPDYGRQSSRKQESTFQTAIG